MKKFSKLELLQSVGFLDANPNRENLRFDKSQQRSFQCLLKMCLKIAFVLKFYLSSLFDRDDPIQLYIGRSGSEFLKKSVKRILTNFIFILL